MGYIPPVHDEQSVLYGNRLDPTYRGIKPASPVMKANFHGILSDKEKEEFNRRKKKEYKSNRSNKPNDQNKSKKSKVLRDLTGKGYYINEVV